MATLRLTLACGDYDRTRPLRDGTVAVEGVERTAIALPWLPAEVEETRELIGTDLWPDGVARNRSVIETVAQYAVEQGWIHERPLVEALFAASTLREP